MVQVKTIDCVSEVFGKGVRANSLANVLNSYIDGGKYNDARAFVRALNISDDSKEKIIACIYSYKESC